MRYRAVISLLSITVPVLLFMTGTACRSTKPVAGDPDNLAYIYNPRTTPFSPVYRIVNQPDDRSIVSVKLFADELFFSEANPSGEPLSSLTLMVRIYNDTKGGVVADTAALEVTLDKSDNSTEYVVNIPVTTYDDMEYTAEVRITDNLTRRRVQSFIKFHRLSEYAPFNFTARSLTYNTELFNPIVMNDEYVSLNYQYGDSDTLYIKYHPYFDHVPYPPSMMLPERTVDSEPIRVIPFLWTDTAPMKFPSKGIYLCTPDSNATEGFTFFNFGDEYPDITSAESLIAPLAYIATSEEMVKMNNSSTPKIAIDEFWLARSNSIERSRELLRIYYNRVKYANHYFTSYKEGWRSDRGMIYIIYGPPDKVYKNTQGERWGYKKPVIESRWGSRYKVQEEYLYFNFRYNSNRFSNNDYYLSRTDATPTFWEQAVQTWRNGIVFRLDNPGDI